MDVFRGYIEECDTMDDGEIGAVRQRPSALA
jgi:hypothetical protein